MTIDRREPVYLEGSTAVYRASKLGALCPRALAACRLGMPGAPPSEKHQADLDAGIAYELVLTTQLERIGDLSRIQEEVEVPGPEGTVIRAHLDGVGTNLTKAGVDSAVIEMKSCAPSTFALWQRRRFDAFPAWRYQLGAAMIATGLPGLMAVGERRTNALHLHAVREVSAPLLMEMQAKIARVEVLAMVGELGECEEAFPCPWFYLHDGPVLTPEATPERIRVILREAHRRAVGALRGRVELRLAEVGEWSDTPPRT